MDKGHYRIIEKLVATGAITKEQYQGIIYHHKSNGGHVEEAVIDTGALDEENLLKHLAHIYKTRFVATEKLRRAEIPREVLDLIPYKLASQRTVFPILYNKKSGELSVVVVDPSDVAVEQELSQTSQVPRVRSFVARPAAIKAAIHKFYRGDIHAFAHVDSKGKKDFHAMLDMYDRNVLDEESMSISLADVGKQTERTFSLDELKKTATQAEKNESARLDDEMTSVLEMLKVLVSLIESNRGELAGHSVQTANYVERMCRRIGVSERDIAGTTMAALLHDLGKGSPYHLTAFNVAEWDGHRIAAQKRFDNPERLFQAVALPESTFQSLHHMYERFDGQGLPEKIHGKDIPLGSRILAIADTFSDLTSNPRNPYRRTLSTEEALKVLQKGRDQVFDGNLVDLFRIVVAGEDIKRQLLTGSQTILVIDGDPEQSAILDLQLTSRGFRVKTVRTADLALKMLGESGASIIVSEVDIEPFDGFELKEKINASEKARDIPFIYFSGRSASSDVEKGFALGAQDYLVKPSKVDVLAAKIHKYLGEKTDSTGGGVSGSLSEMSLPDLVQILSHGRKNGQLSLTMGHRRGEIHFVNGEIHNALFESLRGEEAFFQMLRHKDGSFILNPNFKTQDRSIQMTSEMLLLEGMRRFDEDTR